MDFKKITETLAEHRILLVRGDIKFETQEVLCTAIELLDLTSHEPINLRIDSCGGSTIAGNLIADSIKFAKSPIFATVVGFAYSAAFTLLQQCDRRLAYPNARLMFHGVRMHNPPRVDQPNFEQEIKQGKKQNEVNLRLISRKSGQSLKKIKEWSRTERYFSAEEALELNFIDEILTPPKKRSLK